MKQKHLIILCCVLAGLMALVVFKNATRTKVPTTEIGSDVVPVKLDPYTLTSASLQAGDKKIIIKKNKKGWVLDTYFQARVDDIKFINFIEELNGLEGEVRSNNASVLDDYGISDAQGLHIVLSQGNDTIAHLIIGTRRAGVTNFVRLQGRDAVFGVDKNVLALAGLWGEVTADNLKETFWIDKNLFKFDNTAVKSVQIRQDATPEVNLKKTSIDAGAEKWIFEKSYPFDPDPMKITRYLQGLANIKVVDVVPIEEVQKDKKVWALTLGIEGQPEPLVLSRGATLEGEDMYLARVSDMPYGYKVATVAFKNAEKVDGDFFADHPLSWQKDAVSRVRVDDTRNGKTAELTKGTDEEQTGWIAADGREVDAQNVERLIDAITSLELTTDPMLNQTLDVVLSVTFKENEEIMQFDFTDKVTRDGKTCRYLKISGSDLYFCIPGGDLSSLDTALEELWPQEKQDSLPETDTEVSGGQ